MIRNIGVLIILVLLAFASYIVINRGMSANGGRVETDIAYLGKLYQSPTNYIYPYYVKDTAIGAATSTQQRFIAAHALVINKDEMGNVARLKELALSNIPADTIVGDTTIKRDSIYQLQVEEKSLSGEVNLSADEVLYFPIAYDDHWHVVVDVTDLKPFKINSGGMGVFLEKGRHHIALVHKFPLSSKLILAAEIIGLVGLFVLLLFYNRKGLMELTRPRQLTLPEKTLILAAGFVAIAIIVYFNFYRWRTDTVYGDDLFTFKDYFGVHGIWNRIVLQVDVQKFRPVHGVVFNSLIESFHKNTNLYYLFNSFIIAVDTFLLAMILNLFLNSYLFSFLFALTFGLSKFFYYCVNQLLFGGAMEGLALAFFLCFTFFIVSAAIEKNGHAQKKLKYLLLSVLFANLCIYVHERYVITFGFLLIILFLYKGFRELSIRQKAIVASCILLSPLLNIFIKKTIYPMPFLLGTGGAKIKFSLSQVISFLEDGVLSIFQVNSGPEYLAGINYPQLPVFEKTLVWLMLSTLGVAAVLYVYNALRSGFKPRTPENESQSLRDSKVDTSKAPLVFFLCMLYMVCLAPAVSTIRLEQRWLTASLAVYILICVIIFSSFKYRNNLVKYAVFFLFIFPMIKVNATYFDGINNVFMYTGEKNADQFKDALNKNIIHANTTKLYLWEKQRDVNTENGLMWVLCDGYIFNFYGAAEKQLTFVDSVYTRKDSGLVTSFPDFNPQTSQIILFDTALKDITGEYLKDSLKSFLAERK